MMWSYLLSKVLRLKMYCVLMKNFSVSGGLANLSSFRKVASFGLWMLWS